MARTVNADFVTSRFVSLRERYQIKNELNVSTAPQDLRASLMILLYAPHALNSAVQTSSGRS